MPARYNVLLSLYPSTWSFKCLPLGTWLWALAAPWNIERGSWGGFCRPHPIESIRSEPFTLATLRNICERQWVLKRFFSAFFREYSSCVAMSIYLWLLNALDVALITGLVINSSSFSAPSLESTPLSLDARVVSFIVSGCRCDMPRSNFTRLLDSSDRWRGCQFPRRRRFL